MKTLPLAAIPNPALRDLAARVDRAGSAGDGALSVEEVDKALATAKADPAQQDQLERLSQLRTLVSHLGQDGRQAAPTAISGGGYSPLSARAASMTGAIREMKPPLLLDEGGRPDSISRMFRAPAGKSDIPAGQSLLFPLDSGKLHYVEVRYHDDRPVKDLELNYKEPGSYEWKTFKGDQWFEMLKREKAGEIQIKREPDHNGPWVNNPVRVKVEVLYPDGRVHDMGKKLVDFHIHDARSINGPGTPETDNIYKRMPPGELPPGCMMRLTPFFENQKPWESGRDKAVRFEFAKPISVPLHKEKARVFSDYQYQPIPPGGYDVDPVRKIAAVMINWTDEGGIGRGSVSVKGERGTTRSGAYNVGSGETELIPVDARAVDGKLHVHNSGATIKVRSVDVLYAE